MNAVVCLVVGFAFEQPATAQSPWWESTGKNYWSPQSTIVAVVGTDALNCGHHGPGASEQSLVKSLACAQDASRGRKAFYTIRSFKGPDEKVVSPPPQPSIEKVACSSPRVIPDASGTFKFACPK